MDCDRKHYAKGLCNAHYQQRYVSGTELFPLGAYVNVQRFPKFDTLREKIEYGLHKAPSGHWIWGYAKGADGYGVVQWDGSLHRVHRAYMMELGHGVPADMEIDHLCRIRICANPMHLDVVTSAVNKQRIPEELRRRRRIAMVV